jgi:hypothetical protein
MVGAMLEAFTWVGVGCLIVYVLWFGIGTLWIAFVPNADQRTARRYAKPFNLSKFMGM